MTVKNNNDDLSITQVEKIEDIVEKISCVSDIGQVYFRMCLQNLARTRSPMPGVEEVAAIRKPRSLAVPTPIKIKDSPRPNPIRDTSLTTEKSKTEQTPTGLKHTL